MDTDKFKMPTDIRLYACMHQNTCPLPSLMFRREWIFRYPKIVNEKFLKAAQKI